MKKLIIAAFAFLVGSGFASAADLPMKAPRPVPVAVFSWTGFYVGGFVGAAAGQDVTSKDPLETASNGALPVGQPYDCPAGAAAIALAGGFAGPCQGTYKLGSSFIGGGTIGYNWQMSSLVLGLEGEAGYMRLRGNGVDNATAGLPCSLTGPFTLPPSQCNTFFSAKVGDAYGVASARVGVAFDHVLLYGKFGAAFANATTAVSDTCSVAPCGAGLLQGTTSKTMVGYAAGAGIEYALSSNWSIKGEYLYLGFSDTLSACGQQSNPAVPASFGATFCSTTKIGGISTGKFGVNYHFGGPVVAKY
jgi:outer membrane immunogenic protein